MAFTVAGALLGRGHRGHAVRPLPRPRRAPQRLREDRGLRGHLRSWSARPPASRCTFPGTSRTAPAELRSFAEARGLFFDSMNSNTFEDQPDQRLSYKFGSLSHTDPAVRAPGGGAQPPLPGAGSEAGRALPHGLGRRRRQLPGPGPLPGCPGALPGEPARGLSRPARRAGACSSSTSSTSRRSTRRSSADWGTSYYCVRELGERAFSLVDLGHHAPNVNIEMIVARLIQFGKLARLPLQRQQVRGRRSRRRLHQAVPALPHLQRAGGRRAQPRCRASTPPTCSTSRTT